MNRNSKIISKKQKIRLAYLERRNGISPERQKAAKELFKKLFAAETEKHSHILSYSCIGSELSLDHFNSYIASSGRLTLPLVAGNQLHLYSIKDLSTELKKGSWGIMEPIPELCDEVDPQQISLAYIPGIAFDSNNHRIGYGKGYYDRLIPKLNKEAITVGVGFKEQFSKEPFEFEAHDIPLKKLALL